MGSRVPAAHPHPEVPKVTPPRGGGEITVGANHIITYDKTFSFDERKSVSS